MSGGLGHWGLWAASVQVVAGFQRAVGQVDSAGVAWRGMAFTCGSGDQGALTTVTFTGAVGGSACAARVPCHPPPGDLGQLSCVLSCSSCPRPPLEVC